MLQTTIKPETLRTMDQVQLASIDLRDKLKPDYILDHVMPRLISKTKAQADEDIGIITEHFVGSLYIRWVVILGEDETGEIALTVSQDCIRAVGVTLDEIKTAALSNIKDTTDIEPIEQMLPIDMVSTPAPSFLVATNKRKHFGAAAVLLQPETLAEQERKIGSFNIIPSSVHEVLLIPDALGIPAEELKAMLIDVNRTIVEEKDILDDHIYRVENGELKMID